MEVAYSMWVRRYLPQDVTDDPLFKRVRNTTVLKKRSWHVLNLHGELKKKKIRLRAPHRIRYDLVGRTGSFLGAEAIHKQELLYIKKNDDVHINKYIYKGDSHGEKNTRS